MRDDVFFKRIGLDTGAIGTRPETSPSVDAYSTTNSVAYQSTYRDGLSTGRTTVHKNLSTLPLFDGPPSGRDHFSTTARDSFSAMGSTPAATPRHQATFKSKMERSSVLAETVNVPKTTTAGTMFAGAADFPRKVNPRFVNGGDFRNHSEVALGRNLTKPGVAEGELTTTSRSTWGAAGAPSQRPTHRFELPQKNTSTYLTTDMGPPAGAEPRRPPTIGRMTPSYLATRTDPTQPSQRVYRTSARGGVGHYATSMGTQFSEPGVALVVPPGKGGIDMTRSVVPLGSMNSGATPSAYPTPAAHTGSAYMGAQLPNGLQPRCPSRGSLGARGGKQLIR